MNDENPTCLRIGMHGVFAGKDFRLIGRVVMGVAVASENYFWNEFNLETKSGERATLVFDESDDHATWRLFTEFQPDYPMPAADAARKQVGDVVNLTGEDVRVTWVSSSQVHHVEGSAPKNLLVGDVDNYFNAEQHDVMQVVSWTGDAVEYFHGITLTNQAIATAFRVSGISPSAQRLPDQFDRAAQLDGGEDSENNLSLGKFILWAGVLAFSFFALLAGNFSCGNNHESSPVKKIYAPAKPPLAVGATGKWEGKDLRITAHAVVELAEVGAIFERHEYELTDDYGLVTLLVGGEKPGASDWTLYTPLTPITSPTPQQSAAQRAGDAVTVDGVTATVAELFQATVRSQDNVATTGGHPGEVNFGYVARGQNNLLLARWNDSAVKFYRGESVAAKKFSAAFSPRSPP